jgi:hypothetical protein
MSQTSPETESERILINRVMIGLRVTSDLDYRPWKDVERAVRAAVVAGHAQTPAVLTPNDFIRLALTQLKEHELRRVVETISKQLAYADTSTDRLSLPAERSCQCDSPVIRCDNRGCRCTICGELERLPIPTHREGEHQS